MVGRQQHRPHILGAVTADAGQRSSDFDGGVECAIVHAMRLCGPQAEVPLRIEVIGRNTMVRGIANDDIGHATLRALSSVEDTALAADMVEQDSDIHVIWTQGFGFPAKRCNRNYAAWQTDATRRNH